MARCRWRGLCGFGGCGFGTNYRDLICANLRLLRFRRKISAKRSDNIAAAGSIGCRCDVTVNGEIGNILRISLENIRDSRLRVRTEGGGVGVYQVARYGRLGSLG